MNMLNQSLVLALVVLASVSVQAATNDVAAPLESFTSLDGELYVSMDNLTNSHYAYYPGYPMGGIMWFFGCKLKF